MVLRSPPPYVPDSRVQLYTPAFRAQYLALHDDDRYWTGERVLAAQDTFRVPLAIEDGEAAGYAILSRSFSPESGSPICWIEELYIRKAYRGHGLGTKFFSSVRKEFPSARLRLEVEPENTGAVALCKRHGFTPLEYVSYVVEPDGADA